MDTKLAEHRLVSGGRRSKNDPYGRCYKCGCGSSYLSYPALYTHVKKKHAGVKPEGTLEPVVKQEHSKGRPPKVLGDVKELKEEEATLIEHCCFGGPTNPRTVFSDTESGLDREIRKLLASNVLLNDLELPIDAAIDSVLALYLTEVAHYVDETVYNKIADCIKQLHLASAGQELDSVLKAMISKASGVDFETLRHLYKWLYIRGLSSDLIYCRSNIDRVS